MYYEWVWGVGELRVKSAESGEVIRFSYRVPDAEKAKALNDKKNEPSQIDSGAAARYRKQKQLLVCDVPEKEVAAARATTEYKEAYAWISDELGKLPKDKAVRACSASLEGGNHGSR
jgi:hypothetical protein